MSFNYTSTIQNLVMSFYCHFESVCCFFAAVVKLWLKLNCSRLLPPTWWLAYRWPYKCIIVFLIKFLPQIVATTRWGQDHWIFTFQLPWRKNIRCLFFCCCRWWKHFKSWWRLLLTWLQCQILIVVIDVVKHKNHKLLWCNVVPGC